MTEHTLYRFSHAEFYVMTALAGADGCTVYLPKTVPDDAALIQAMSSLYRRDMLRREDDRLVPDGAGALFSSLRKARCVVLLYAALPDSRHAACYLFPDHLWMAELLDDGFRVQKKHREEMSAWLLDAGILKTPALHSQDLPELTVLYGDELAHPRGECLLRMEKRRNGNGSLIREYQILRGPGIEILCTLDGVDDRTEFCSRETLESFIGECFSDETV